MTHDLVPHAGVELPTQAFLGTVFLRSPLGTLVEFYSYIHPDFKTDDLVYLDRGWDQKIIRATFHVLARADKIHFRKWDDFTIYDTDTFHRLLNRLSQNGFRIYLKNENIECF